MPNTTLRRIYINSQGYTAEGEYYGTGQPLYRWGHDCDHCRDCMSPTLFGGVLRAWDRKGAKAIVKRHVPHATFFK